MQNLKDQDKLRKAEQILAIWGTSIEYVSMTKNICSQTEKNLSMIHLTKRDMHTKQESDMSEMMMNQA